MIKLYYFKCFSKKYAGLRNDPDDRTSFNYDINFLLTGATSSGTDHNY